jgi:hypothetical protein
MAMEKKEVINRNFEYMVALASPVLDVAAPFDAFAWLGDPPTIARNVKSYPSLTLTPAPAPS